MRPNTVNDFWAKVTMTENGCWTWNLSRDKDGYGFFWWKNKQLRAHKFSWTISNGEIPTGMMVCHKCDNPSCVRPDHLFLGTGKDNIQDCLRKGRGLQGRKRNPESVRKTADGRRGKKWTQEMRDRASQYLKGRKPSEEARRNMSIAQTGRKHSEETKRKIGSAHRGTKRSQEAINNITRAQQLRRLKERGELR